MSIFKQMWNGEIYPATMLEDALTEEQKELHYSYQNASAIAATLIQQEIFKVSFKLGVKFQKEIDDKDCLPDNE